MSSEIPLESIALESRPCNVSAPIDAQKFEEMALETLKSKGFRITMARVQVIRVLTATHAALSPQTIHERILASSGKIDVVSVYRILNTLEEVGLIHHIGIVDGYFACRHEHAEAHTSQHLVCRTCGCVSEVSAPLLSTKMLEDRAREIEFEPSAMRIELLGECVHCQRAS